MKDGKTESSKKESKLIKTSLNGLVRLEHYPEKGFVMTIQVDKDKFFFMEMGVINAVVEDYNEIIKLKGGNVITQTVQAEGKILTVKNLKKLKGGK